MSKTLSRLFGRVPSMAASALALLLSGTACGGSSPSGATPDTTDGSIRDSSSSGGSGGSGTDAFVRPIPDPTSSPPSCAPVLFGQPRLCESTATSCPYHVGLDFNCTNPTSIDMVAASRDDVFFVIDAMGISSTPEVPGARGALFIERHGAEVTTSPGPEGGHLCKVRLVAGAPVVACQTDDSKVQLALRDGARWSTEIVAEQGVLGGIAVGPNSQVDVLVWTGRIGMPPTGLALHSRDAQGQWTSRALSSGPVANTALGFDGSGESVVAAWVPRGETYDLHLFQGELAAQVIVTGAASDPALEVHAHGTGVAIFSRADATAYVASPTGYVQTSLLPAPTPYTTDCPQGDACVGADVTCTEAATSFGAASLAMSEDAGDFVAYLRTRVDRDVHISNCSAACSCTQQTTADRGSVELVIADAADLMPVGAELHTDRDVLGHAALMLSITGSTLHVLRNGEYRALDVP
jgi:hypothetical protein